MVTAVVEAAPDRNARILVAYVRDGMTMDEIGQRYGVTRQRIHQILTKEDKTLWKLESRRRKARTRMERLLREAEARAPKQARCGLCGKGFEYEHGGGRPDGNRYCSGVHRKIYDLIRYQIDEGRRESTLLRTAEWIVRNPEKAAATGQSVAYGQHVVDNAELEGRNAGRRWATHGSLAFHWLVRAYVLEWPVFERVHPVVQDQIRKHVEGDG